MEASVKALALAYGRLAGQGWRLLILGALINPCSVSLDLLTSLRGIHSSISLLKDILTPPSLDGFCP
jgi:hypothetical protein